MDTQINFIENFKKEGYKRLLHLFQESGIMIKEDSEAAIHGLIDISESIENIYSVILPKMVNLSSNEKIQIEELMDDLKMEFSHILYHIENGKLAGLRYWE
jgi:hypothetical protein